MKKILIALAIFAVSATAQAPKISNSGSFLEKNGFVASLGFSHAKASLHATSRHYNDNDPLSSNLPNLSAGVKYANFLATLTIENGELKSKKGKSSSWEVEYKSMGGLLNLDVLLGKDTFAILGAGIAKNTLQLNKNFQIDGFSFTLRAGGGFAKKITNNAYFFTTGIIRYSPKILNKDLEDGVFRLSNLLSFGANIGVAF